MLEIMIVVVIIGVIAALAVPALMNARKKTQNARFVNDIRQFRSAIESYLFSEGALPVASNVGELPTGMEKYISPYDFQAGTTLGGSWNAEINSSGVVCAVGVEGVIADDEQLLRIDQKIDDGNLSTGQLRKLSATQFYWVIQD